MLKIWYLLLLLLPSYLLAKPLRIVSEHLPPHQISENAKFTGGHSYLIMKEVVKRANLTTRLEVLPWARAYKMAQEEPNTIIFSLVRSADRENKFHWIGELGHVEFNFYAHRDSKNPQLSKISEALKYKIVAVRNSISTEILLKFGFKPDENLTLTVGILDAWQMLRKGRADFTYTSTVIADNMYINMGLTENEFIRQNAYTIRETLYVAASLNTDKIFIDKIKIALGSMKRDGSYQRILDKPHPAYE